MRARALTAAAPRSFRRPAPKPATSSSRVLAIAIVGVLAAAIALLLAWGAPYYLTPLAERSRHPLHALLKPSGTVGRSLAIAGTSMMLLIFLYSVRKRSKTLQKIGTQAVWLKVHIFLGFAGPLLVTIHTTGKLNGIVAIAFYSMWAIVLSGMVGRYLYAKIPRTISGNQMTLDEIQQELATMVDVLRESEQRESVLGGIERFLAGTRKETGGLLRAIARVVGDDVSRPFKALTVWRIVSADASLPFRRRWQVSRLVLRQQRLLNKLAVLDASKRLFAYWHVFHKPFTVITFAIVMLHVGVAVYLGYGLHW